MKSSDRIGYRYRKVSSVGMRVFKPCCSHLGVKEMLKQMFDGNQTSVFNIIQHHVTSFNMLDSIMSDDVASIWPGL